MELLLSQLLSESELIQVAELKNADLYLLLGYIIASLTTKRAVFIMVFFIDYIAANSILLDGFSDFNYYLFPAFLYSTLYWHLIDSNKSVKVQLACVIVVLFYFMAALDVKFNSNTKTVLYIYYVPITLFVHLNFIITLVDWKLLRTFVGKTAITILVVFGISDTVSCLLYNYKKYTKI